MWTKDRVAFNASLTGFKQLTHVRGRAQLQEKMHCVSATAVLVFKQASRILHAYDDSTSCPNPPIIPKPRAFPWKPALKHAQVNVRPSWKRTTKSERPSNQRTFASVGGVQAYEPVEKSFTD